ncbi:hypothetical protein [Catelliglobosispora koreensis]|uniref:hypothetical protein n=1 Tax=Catelliglobosispora koreensis TaxID=129052 RepID=UPI0012FC5186|nr:hypothetical protein [Catelliglobosispora koreensis]
MPPQSGHHMFLIEDLPSVAEAHERFAALRTGALAASLYLGGGVRISRELDVLDDTTPVPNNPGQAIVFPKGRSLAGIRLVFGQIQFQEDIALPRFFEGLQLGLTHPVPQQAAHDSKVELAGMLFVDSYYEATPQARFITLIGALEVLKDQDSRSPEALELIAQWRDQVKASELEDRVSLLSQLDHLTSISIGQGIKAVVRRHLGDKEAKEASALYTVGSKLVHYGETPSDMEKVAGRAAELVASLLAKILSNGQL